MSKPRIVKILHLRNHIKVDRCWYDTGRWWVELKDGYKINGCSDWCEESLDKLLKLLKTA